MQSNAGSTEEYINVLPENRKPVIKRLRSLIRGKLPVGFEETMNYGMIAYVVPHALYPSGYHPNPKTPLPFINLTSQKNYIAFYHMGLYADKDLLQWFESEYASRSTTKLDMGKSCIRFKNPEHIPWELLGDLATKMTPQEWIVLYEKKRKF